MASTTVQAAVDRLPPRAGVYLFKDEKGRILYIGKAKRLDHRGRSYMVDETKLHPRTARMVRQARDLDFIVTDSEAEALVLEANLVREHRPHFNVMLKDDKTFPWVKLSIAEEVPRLSITRKVVEDGSRYFGPYTDVGVLRRTLRYLRRVFPVRTCVNFEHFRRVDRPCLNYYIRRCVGPCYSKSGVTPKQYQKHVEGLALFLSGNQVEVRQKMRVEMEAASESREFERAALLRDQLSRLDRLNQIQKMSSPGSRDADALGMARQGNEACVVILKLREGRVTGRETRFLRGTGGSEVGKVFEGFLAQYYLNETYLPKEVWLPRIQVESELLQRVLSERGTTVRIRVAQRARPKQLVKLAQDNAETALESRIARRTNRPAHYDASVYELQRTLELPEPPVRAVCFDISNLGPSDSVASVTVSVNSLARRSDYRRMRMRGVGPDDFAMMKEAVTRYFAHVVAEEYPRPDLVVIDGGVGQVGAAKEALDELGLRELPLIGLAKKEEKIVFPGGRELTLSRRSGALQSVQRLRDEAHRFAVNYHRKLRTRRTVSSALDKIPGVGPARRRSLLSTFGSVAAIRGATVDEIVDRASVPRNIAERVQETLQKGSNGTQHGASF